MGWIPGFFHCAKMCKMIKRAFCLAKSHRFPPHSPGETRRSSDTREDETFGYQPAQAKTVEDRFPFPSAQKAGHDFPLASVTSVDQNPLMETIGLGWPRRNFIPDVKIVPPSP